MEQQEENLFVLSITNSVRKMVSSQDLTDQQKFDNLKYVIALVQSVTGLVVEHHNVPFAEIIEASHEG